MDHYLIAVDEDGELVFSKVDTPFQFKQAIPGFEEKFGEVEDDENIKNMTYTQKKHLNV